MQNAQGVTFQVDVEAAARDRRVPVDTRVAAQLGRYLDAASGYFVQESNIGRVALGPAPVACHIRAQQAAQQAAIVPHIRREEDGIDHIVVDGEAGQS